MKNLKPYTDNSIGFLEEIIKSKRNSTQDVDYKERIKLLKDNVAALFVVFDEHHKNNNQTLLEPYGYVLKDKEDLLKLYNPSAKKLIELKESITTVLDNRVMNKCQYCTITTISSLDHVIPKEEFPEYAVNPNNLIPSCSTCNSSKSVNWRSDLQKIFINLYTDILPEVQYLYVDFQFEDNLFIPRFYLENRDSIPDEIYDLITSHYNRLKLLDRFSRASGDIISEFNNLISSLKTLDIEVIKEVVLDKIEKDKSLFGINYFKSILEESLFLNPIYIKSILK